MKNKLLVACTEYFRALRFPHAGDRHFAFFLISGGLMMLCVGYFCCAIVDQHFVVRLELLRTPL